MGFRIAVVGSGAIGSYYGAKLAHAGSDVHFLMRRDLGDVRRDGIFVRGEGENFRVATINYYNSTKEIGACDLVIIAIKATSNADIVDLVPPLAALWWAAKGDWNKAHALVMDDESREAACA